MSLITKENFERSQIKRHSYSNWALVEEGSLGTFTLGLISTELPSSVLHICWPCSAEPKLPFKRQQLEQTKRTYSPEWIQMSQLRRLDAAQIQQNLHAVWSGREQVPPFRATVDFCLARLPWRGGFCICSTWGLSWKEGRDRMGELNRAVSLQRHNNIYGI